MASLEATYRQVAELHKLAEEMQADNYDSSTDMGEQAKRAEKIISLADGLSGTFTALESALTPPKKRS